jgi:hypothetical protein
MAHRHTLLAGIQYDDPVDEVLLARLQPELKQQRLIMKELMAFLLV